MAVFGSIFNNIKIVRNGGTEVRVPIAYGPRKKFLARIESDRVTATGETIALKMPRMSFEITEISYDTASKLNRFNKRYFPIVGEAGKYNTTMQSVPYNIGMQLNIFATNQDDALQVFEQILPLFAPEYTIAIKNLEGPNTSTDVPIVLNGTSFSDEYEGGLQDATRRTIIYTLDFTLKVRFTGAIREQSVIRIVDTFFYPTIENRADVKAEFPYGYDNVENFRITVAEGDEPPLDDSDTITTTFGFDYDSP